MVFDLSPIARPGATGDINNCQAVAVALGPEDVHHHRYAVGIGVFDVDLLFVRNFGCRRLGNNGGNRNRAASSATAAKVNALCKNVDMCVAPWRLW